MKVTKSLFLLLFLFTVQESLAIEGVRLNFSRDSIEHCGLFLAFAENSGILLDSAQFDHRLDSLKNEMMEFYSKNDTVVDFGEFIRIQNRLWKRGKCISRSIIGRWYTITNYIISEYRDANGLKMKAKSLRHGEEISYEDGALSIQTNFHLGFESGPRLIYSKKGRLLSIYCLARQPNTDSYAPVGLMLFHKNGKPKSIEFYDNFELTDHVFFDKRGRRINRKEKS